MNQQIRDILDNQISQKTFPGSVVAWIRGGEEGSVAAGRLRYDKDSPKVNKGTVYDVASITKSIPLASLAHIALQRGLLGLDERAVQFLPQLSGHYHELITIKDLLTYTAIWDLDRGLSRIAHDDGAGAVMDALYTAPLVEMPGKRIFYTNAPAIILGLIVERVLGDSLDRLANEELFKLLKMNSTTFEPAAMADEVVAPTEVRQGVEVYKSVHDEAAAALRQQGIVAGNAGLFSCAGDLLKYFRMLFDGGQVGSKQIFDDRTIKSFSTNYLENIDQSAGLGWELNQSRYMGRYSNPDMFGKTGFTGCVVIADIKRKIALVHLSNSQYPLRKPQRQQINIARCQLANIVFAK